LVRRNGVASSIDVTLGGEVHDRVEAPLGHQLYHQGPIGDVPAHEPIPRARRDPGQVVRIAGVGQRVEVGHFDRGVGFQLEAHEVGADEPATTRHQNSADRHRACHLRVVPPTALTALVITAKALE